MKQKSILSLRKKLTFGMRMKCSFDIKQTWWNDCFFVFYLFFFNFFFFDEGGGVIKEDRLSN